MKLLARTIGNYLTSFWDRILRIRAGIYFNKSQKFEFCFHDRVYFCSKRRKMTKLVGQLYKKTYVRESRRWKELKSEFNFMKFQNSHYSEFEEIQLGIVTHWEEHSTNFWTAGGFGRIFWKEAAMSVMIFDWEIGQRGREFRGIEERKISIVEERRELRELTH